MDEIRRAKNVICSLTSSTRSSARGPRRHDGRLQHHQTALSRGELQCIGRHDVERVRKYIEKDAALERRFQCPRRSSLQSEEAILILRASAKYEDHHKRKFKTAIEASVSCPTATSPIATSGQSYRPDGRSRSRARIGTMTVHRR